MVKALEDVDLDSPPPITFILYCLCFVNILEEGGVEFALSDLPVIAFTLGTLEVGFMAYFTRDVFSFCFCF